VLKQSEVPVQRASRDSHRATDIGLVERRSHPRGERGKQGGDLRQALDVGEVTQVALHDRRQVGVQPLGAAVVRARHRLREATASKTLDHLLAPRRGCRRRPSALLEKGRDAPWIDSRDLRLRKGPKGVDLDPAGERL
jgi:hypothetical protein